MRFRALSYAVGALFLTACATGPTWHTAFEVPAPTSPLDGKTIVVSGFRTSERIVSTTMSMQLMELMESVNVMDMSGQVASRLSEAGIVAEARVGFDRGDLAPNQLLLRGAAIANRSYHRGGGLALLYFAGAPLTLLALFADAPELMPLALAPMVLPSPVEVRNGFEFVYAVDLIDHEGRLVLSSGQRSGVIAYGCRFLYCPMDQAALARAVRETTADLVAQALRTGRAARVGPGPVESRR